MTVPTLRVGLPLVLVALLAVPASAAAAPVLVHDTTTITEGAPRNGVIEGGDTVTISERISNDSAGPISGLTGTLTSATPTWRSRRTPRPIRRSQRSARR